MKKKKKEEPVPDVESSDPSLEDALQYHHEQSFVGAHREDREAKKAALQSWKPIAYHKNNCQLYMVGRLAPNFAVACRVLYEIRKRCPLFVPHSMFNFASGLGTYVW